MMLLRKQRRIWTVFCSGLGLLPLLGLIGCGSSSTPSSEANAVAPEETPDVPENVNITLPFRSVRGGTNVNEAKELAGEGGTFPAPLYKRWFDAYSSAIGVKVTYKAAGSVEGIRAISNRLVDFGASDAPMTDEQLRKARGGQILHIPTAFGGIVLAYNLPGLKSKLKLTPQTLSGIYLGEITRWNDPQLVADNPELASANQGIISVHRTDGSGTTYALTDYLSGINPVWNKHSGKGTAVTWPVGIGRAGNAGIADEVSLNPYSVGYMELGFALRKKVPFALLKNSSGRFVDATLPAITAAAGSNGSRGAGDLRFSVVNAPGSDAYPLCTGTWLLVYQNMTDQRKATALTRLLWWATHDAQAANEPLHYAPVPATITARSEALIRSMTFNGAPAYPGR